MQNSPYPDMKKKLGTAKRVKTWNSRNRSSRGVEEANTKGPMWIPITPSMARARRRSTTMFRFGIKNLLKFEEMQIMLIILMIIVPLIVELVKAQKK